MLLDRLKHYHVDDTYNTNAEVENIEEVVCFLMNSRLLFGDICIYPYYIHYETTAYTCRKLELIALKFMDAHYDREKRFHLIFVQVFAGKYKYIDEDGEKKEGRDFHDCLLVYDHTVNSISLYDPNGRSDKSYFFRPDIFLPRCIEKIDLFKDCQSIVFADQKSDGPQVIESKCSKYKKDVPQGYCAIWNAVTAMLLLQNPFLKPDDIVHLYTEFIMSNAIRDTAFARNFIVLVHAIFAEVQATKCVDIMNSPDSIA